jgi:hypothetical protein
VQTRQTVANTSIAAFDAPDGPLKGSGTLAVQVLMAHKGGCFALTRLVQLQKLPLHALIAKTSMIHRKS